MFQKKFDCRNKVVLITGASSGIGEAVAKTFAAAGANVALVARNKEALERIAEYIRGKGGSAGVFPFDLENIEQIPTLVKSVEEYFRASVTILINNAGIAVLGLVAYVPVSEYQRNFTINCLAPLALIKAVILSMQKKREGQIINITSGVGVRGLPGASSYCMSKFALNALTESVRVELGRFGISVISISPGLVASQFAKHLTVHGPLKEMFTYGAQHKPETVARWVLRASRWRQREVVRSLRTRVARHLNYWTPRLFDRILSRTITTTPYDH